MNTFGNLTMVEVCDIIEGVTNDQRLLCAKFDDFIANSNVLYNIRDRALIWDRDYEPLFYSYIKKSKHFHLYKQSLYRVGNN